MKSALLVVSTAVFLAAPISPVHASSAPAPAPAPASPAAPIVMVFMENVPYATMVGNPNAPYINSMITGGMSATNMYAIEPGSKTDYLAATSGRNFKNMRGPFDVDNLFNQLQTAGMSQRSYEEAMPRPCFAQNAAGTDPESYAKRHDPAILYSDIRTNKPVCKATVIPAGTGSSSSQLLADAAHGDLPNFTFLTPNNCNDMHSCPIASGDDYLASVVPSLVSAGAHVILTWDESGNAKNEHIVLVEFGNGVSAGTFTPAINDYGLLAGLEDHFGLPRLAGAQTATAFPVT